MEFEEKHTSLIKYCFKNKEIAKNFWTDFKLEKNLNYPDIVHSNIFWCPENINKSKLFTRFMIYHFLKCRKYN